MSFSDRTAVVDTTSSPHANLRSLPFDAVRLDGGFWHRWQEVNRTHALSYGYQQLNDAQVLANFEVVAGRRSADFQNMRFADSDLYKWLEGAAYELAVCENEWLSGRVAHAVELTSAAQHEDGYLNTFYQLTDPEGRWSNLRDNHELYSAGHLFQAGVAHFRATGERSLLSVATRFADHIDKVFGQGKKQSVPGHPEIEMGLIELSRATGENRYLELARFFIDERGKGLIDGRVYNQDHVPVREADEPAGHAVRQLYLLAGVADLYLETGERTLLAAMERVWDVMTRKKMSITGGVGSRHNHEAFGQSYELPNDRPYNETCAQIASVMWNWRLLLATGEARYADLMEWTLYNGVISGVSLDGRSYFYPNPLLSRGQVMRSGWFDCACCPPNVMRTLGSIHNYVATRDNSGVQLHLYDNCTVEASVGNESVRLRMKSEYPWTSDTQIFVEQSPPSEWTLSVRIPGWCENATLTVAGEAISGTWGTYLRIKRNWQAGDVIELLMPMHAMFNEAHPYVEAARGCVAISRGPLVYCLEQHDQEKDASVLDATVDPSAPVAEIREAETLGGIVALRVEGEIVARGDWERRLYRPVGPSDRTIRRAMLKAIPYFTWANREPAPMTVWIPVAAK